MFFFTRFFFTHRFAETDDRVKKGLSVHRQSFRNEMQ